MTKIRLSQAWIDRATSEGEDEVLVVGRRSGTLPSARDLSAVVAKAAPTEAVREMVRRKWFVAPSTSTRAAALEDFLFGRASRLLPSLAPMFRRQARQRDLVEDIVTLAWLSGVADKAAKQDAGSYNESRLSDSTIAQLVQLSKREFGPAEALSYLAKLGVRVVVENSLPGMHADGASFVVKNVGPVIGLTLRYDRLDNFWFTLLHEIGHLKLHMKRDPAAVFVDSIEDQDDEPAESEIEAEADAFAKDSFVPRDVWLRSDVYRMGNEPAILALAKKLNIHPAVVAGRLRYERRQYKSFAHLLGSRSVRDLLIAG